MSAEPESTPSVEQTREEIEALLGVTVGKLGELVKDGGKVSRQFRCKACGQSETVEIKVADADLMVKALSALSSAAPRLQSKEDATSVKAVKLQADLSALSSAELAEHIATLEAEVVRLSDSD